MEIFTVPSTSTSTSSSFSIAPRFLSVIVFLLMFTSMAFAQNGNDKKGERDKESQQNNWRKVTVCHDGNALEIDESALQAHINHGDAVGPCTNISYTGTVTSYLEEVGKTQEPIGTELKILEESFAVNGSATSDEIFVISKSKLVLIEIVVQRGKKQNVLAFLNSTYNITEFTTSGPDDLLILVLFPIDKVSELNSNADIRFVRPVYKPLTNSGVVTSLGDVAQRSDNARQAFGVTGNGITVGVLSDSYNTKNLASKDYQNGDLPGPENPNGNLTPVNVLKEYPLETIGSRFSTVDEGRAMLQIVHDVAPKASLAFRTGVLSPSDMAQGILDLQAIAGCNVIVDDVTHYKEPFYQDGVIARAVNQVTAAGVQYFTSAGNFGRNSYQAQFNPSNNSSNHDFNLGSGV
ncbi:MAG: hypothetical protein OEU76_08665, partial [Cyclobacteriaceae bacterium]|nr:hypothetical protein [Cyclobacteriaceae bacterium]